MNMTHWAIFIDNTSNKSFFITELLKGKYMQGFEAYQSQKGALFSKLALNQLIDEEERHGAKTITKNTVQSLRTMSSGEQKKALLKHLLETKPDFIVLDNPFDNLDTESQKKLKASLEVIKDTISIIQIISRKADLLPFVSKFATLNKKEVVFRKIIETSSNSVITMNRKLPEPLQKIQYTGHNLIQLKNVSVSYSDKPILKNINWEINRGDFWQLIGKNGSGKTTILSMITGENPKGYGQELYIFGQKKGSGESIWDIKKKIGYFTPSMTDKFAGYHSVENMLISGLNDSIGLYLKPTETQLRKAKEWLLLIDMWKLKDTLFHDLTMGQKRLVMTTRAMIKHPLLLILDEPTAGLDDSSAMLLVKLVNKIANESETAIIFVSHRKEVGLQPNSIYELHIQPNGSIGL